MTLRVDNKNINQHFINYLKKRMLGYMSTILNVKKLSPFDDYFNSEEFKKSSNKTIISTRKVVLLGMTNLIHKRYETTTHIFINPNINYPGTNIKLVDLCNTINFGNMSIDGYPIFTETFDHFSNNINIYIDRCIIGLG
jgi:hypothetical protein